MTDQGNYSQALGYLEKSLKNPIPTDIYQPWMGSVQKDSLMSLVKVYGELTPKQLGSKRKNPLIYFNKFSNNKEMYLKSLKYLIKRYQAKGWNFRANHVATYILSLSPSYQERLNMVKNIYMKFKNSHNQQQSYFPGFAVHVLDTVEHFYNQPKRRNQDIKELEIIARDLLTLHHKHFLRSGKDWKNLFRDYARYLHLFKRAPKASKLKRNLADAHYKKGHWLQAAKLYEELALKSKGEMKLTAASLDAYLKALKFQKNSKLSRLELLEARWGLRHIGQAWVGKYPHDRNSPAIHFNIARSYYEERNFDKALYWLQSFARKYPQNSKLGLAISMTLDAFKEKGNEKQVLVIARRYLGSPEIGRKMKEEIKSIVDDAETALIQKTIKGRGITSEKYIENVIKIAHKNQKTGLGLKALSEAFTALKAKGDPRLFKYAEIMVLRYPRSQKAKTTLLEVIKLSHSVGEFKKAANYMELFQSKYPQNSKSTKLLLEAGKIREDIGDLKGALRVYQMLRNPEKSSKIFLKNKSWRLLFKTASRNNTSFLRSYYKAIAAYHIPNHNYHPFVSEGLRQQPLRADKITQGKNSGFTLS